MALCSTIYNHNCFDLEKSWLTSFSSNDNQNEDVKLVIHRSLDIELCKNYKHDK